MTDILDFVENQLGDFSLPVVDDFSDLEDFVPEEFLDDIDVNKILEELDPIPVITEADILKLIVSDEEIPAGHLRFKGTNLMSKTFLLHIASSNREKTCVLINSKLEGMQQMNILVDTRIGEMKQQNKFLIPHMQLPTELDTFKDFLIDCKANDRLALIPLGYLWEGGGHQNMIIYNPFLDTAEHFEPYGIKTIVPEFLADMFNTAIRKKLRELFKFLGIEYVSPNDICPYLGLQAVDEEKPLDDFDPVGFCVAWSYFFAELRIINPKVNSKVLLEETFKIMGTNPDVLRNFIRLYSNFFRKLINDIGLTGEDKQLFIDILLSVSKNKEAIETVDNIILSSLKDNANIKVI